MGTFKTLFFFTVPKLYALLGLQLVSQDTTDFFKKVVLDTMEERERNNITRPDVIQLLIQLKKGQLQNTKESIVNEKELANFSANVEYDMGLKQKSAIQFTDIDWLGQGIIFFGAGYA